MQKTKRVSQSGVARSFFICIGISVAVMLALSLIGALVATLTDDPGGHLGIISLFVMIISAAAGGVLSSRIRGEGGVGFATLVALTIVLIMLIVNVIVSAGGVGGAAFMNYGCYLGVASLCAYLGRKKPHHRGHKK